MLDPVIIAALTVIVAQLIKAFSPVPLDEATVNSIAAVIVAYLLGLFGLEVVKAGARKAAPSAFENGLLKDE